MLFALSREELIMSLGVEAVFMAPSGFWGSVAEHSPAGRILTSVGIPTGVFQPQKPDKPGRFPLVGERFELAEYEAPPGCGTGVVFGWIPQTHLALDPDTGKIHGFSENGGPVQHGSEHVVLTGIPEEHPRQRGRPVGSRAGAGWPGRVGGLHRGAGSSARCRRGNGVTGRSLLRREQGANGTPARRPAEFGSWTALRSRSSSPPTGAHPL
ncbi:SUKH-4 family immunity protein [Streptomyces sp. NPDC002690]